VLILSCLEKSRFELNPLNTETPKAHCIRFGESLRRLVCAFLVGLVLTLNGYLAKRQKVFLVLFSKNNILHSQTNYQTDFNITSKYIIQYEKPIFNAKHLLKMSKNSLQGLNIMISLTHIKVEKRTKQYEMPRLRIF